MINNIIAGLMAVQTICICFAVYKINEDNKKTTRKLGAAISELRIARGEVRTSAMRLDATKDEIVKEFTNEIRKQVFNLSFLGIRMK